MINWNHKLLTFSIGFSSSRCWFNLDSACFVISQLSINFHAESSFLIDDFIISRSKREHLFDSLVISRSLNWSTWWKNLFLHETCAQRNSKREKKNGLKMTHQMICIFKIFLSFWSIIIAIVTLCVGFNTLSSRDLLKNGMKIWMNLWKNAFLIRLMSLLVFIFIEEENVFKGFDWNAGILGIVCFSHPLEPLNG